MKKCDECRHWVPHPRGPSHAWPMACQLRIDQGQLAPGTNPDATEQCEFFAEKATQLHEPLFTLEEITCANDGL